MGVPSPFTAPTASPLIKLKQLSPELSLLQAVEEVQVLDALPVAACDLVDDSAAGKNLCWADVADEEEVDKEADAESEHSTSLPRSESTASDRSSSSARFAKSESPTTAEGEEKSSPTTALSPRQSAPWQNTARVDASELLSLAANKEPTPYVTHEDLVQMMCRLQYDEWGSLFVIPCMGDYWDNSCEHKVFWCHVTQQENGVLVSPCVSAAACGITEDASGNSFEPSASTSSEPTWIYGADWPHCAAPTTLAIASLPLELSQEDLVEILDKEGFSGIYDFVHLALDQNSQRSLGSAVINLTRHSHGASLAAAIEGRTSWCGIAADPCRVSWSMPLQGLPQLIAHYRQHPANGADVSEELRPAYFSGGFPAPFPKASA